MAVEIVIFHLQPDVTNEDFQASVDATTTLLETQSGFISRTVGQSESGEWLDILYWDSVESAKKASAVFQTDPAGQRFSEYLNPQGIQVFYLETGTNQP
jgi:hypothetical protein